MIQEFQNYLSAVKGYSDNTVLAYGKDLRAFVEYARTQQEAPRWSTISQQDIQAWVVEMHDEGLENTTICRRVSAIRGLYNYAKVQGYREDNPARYVQSPKRAKKLPHTITIEAIAAAIKSSKVMLKTKMMLAIMVETGIRLQECLDLTTQDINSKDREMRIQGKGAKERKVYYGEKTAELLNEYVGEYKGKLFVDSQRQARYDIFLALRPFTDAEKISPHIIRHTMATAMLNNGADLTAIAAILGHVSVKTTEIYAQVANPTVKAQHSKYAPRL